MSVTENIGKHQVILCGSRLTLNIKHSYIKCHQVKFGDLLLVTSTILFQGRGVVGDYTVKPASSLQLVRGWLVTLKE